MPTTRRLSAVLFLGALLLSACARGQAAGPNATATPATTIAPTVTTQTTGAPKVPPSTAGPPVDRPAIRSCAAWALRGSDQGGDGAAGTLWSTIQLRNVSARTCTVKGSPKVQLLGAHGQPLFAAAPHRPGGALVTLRPGSAAQFALGVSDVCDSFVAGSSIQVTPTPGKGSLVVQLGFATCRSPSVNDLEPATG
jgi:Domain of unknown function (DUF4232)